MFLVLALLFLWVFYKWSVNNLEYFKKIGVEYEKPLPLFGNSLDLLLKKKSFIDLTRNSYYKFKSSIVFGFFNFRQINYYITDPELIKRITIKDFDHFTNKDNPAVHADKTFRRVLPFLRDKEWADMRSTLSPIFTSAKMKMMYGLLSDQAKDFVNFFEEKSQNGEVLEIDAKNIFARFTANGISTSALGFEADCVRNVDSEVFKLVANFVDQSSDTLTILKGFLFMAIPKLYKLLGLQLLSKELHNFFRRVVIDQMEDRDRNNISRPDIIQLMLQLKKGQLKQDKESEVDDKELVNFSANIEYDVKSSRGKNTSHFTDDDWIAQGFVFFGAGFDTTSTLLLTTCYELMKNPEIQIELYNEIDSVASTLEGGSVSFEALHKMTFLDMIVSEGLRKWPPIIQTNRICNKDYDVVLGNGKTITIKKDQLIIFPYYHIQNDPAYFPNPEKFDPHRFNNDNKESVVQGTYLPFGLGRRNCIGSRFALMEAKLLLFNLIQKFSIEKCLKTPDSIQHKEGLASSIKQIVYLKFVPRK